MKTPTTLGFPPPSEGDRGRLQAQFLTNKEDIAENLKQIKALIFDWDGVFNDGTKDLEGNSPFSEVDAMGTNLLRFSRYLFSKEKGAAICPPSFIISGEKNKSAIAFAKRENFQAIYGGFKDKTIALNHLCEAHNLQPSEIAFFFDDVLDLNVAALVGLRMLIGRTCNPAMQQYIINHKLADYITQNPGGSGGLREASEMAIAMAGLDEATFNNRVAYSDTYQDYLKARSVGQATFYTLENGAVTATETP